MDDKNINKKLLEQSNNYVKAHRQYVKMAFEILLPNLLGFYNLSKEDLCTIAKNIEKHDLSKFSPEEANAYANYFWEKTKSEKVLKEFKEAAKLHKKRNPHHPEYWMDENKQTTNMPLIYIVEMVCDW